MSSTVSRAKKNLKRGSKTKHGKAALRKSASKYKATGKVKKVAQSGSGPVAGKVAKQASKAQSKSVRTGVRKSIKAGIRSKARASGKKVTKAQVRGRARRQTKALMGGK